MRATLRITWLLSFSLLCHIVCSNGQNTSLVTSTPKLQQPTTAETTIAKIGATATTVAAAAGAAAQPTTPTTNTVTADSANKAPEKVTVTNPPTVPPTNAATTILPAAMTKPTDKQATGQPPASTATNKPPDATTSVSNNNPTPAVTTASAPKGPETSSASSITQTPTIIAAGTNAHVNVGINTEQPKATPTIAPTTGKQDTSLTTSHVNNNQGAGPATVTTSSGGVVASTAGKAGFTTASPTTKKVVDPTTQAPPQITSNKPGTISPTTITASSAPSTSMTKMSFVFPPSSGQVDKENKDLEKLCQQLTENLKGEKCILEWTKHDGQVKFDSVNITVKLEWADQLYKGIRAQKPTDNKTLIAILASCGALLIMIVIFAVCASHHRKPYNENQQHLTEELHTVENGYHDNPTLEVMEVQPEMQEKKMALNGEFNDSWIVPIDNLLKEDIPDEEDTHL